MVQVLFSANIKKKEKLSAGEVGYLVSGIKDIKGAPVGDTLTSNLKEEIKPLPGFKTVTPNVFSSLFTIDSDDYERWRNSSSYTFIQEVHWNGTCLYQHRIGVRILS